MEERTTAARCRRVAGRRPDVRRRPACPRLGPWRSPGATRRDLRLHADRRGLLERRRPDRGDRHRRDGGPGSSNGRRIRSLEAGRRQAVEHPRWAPDGRRLLAIADGRVVVWDAGTGRSLTSLRAPRAKITDARWLPRQRIVTVDDQGSLRLWDGGRPRAASTVTTGAELRMVLTNDRGTSVVALGAESGAGCGTCGRPRSGNCGRRRPASSSPPRSITPASESRQPAPIIASTSGTNPPHAGDDPHRARLLRDGDRFQPGRPDRRHGQQRSHRADVELGTGDPLTVLRGHSGWISGLAFPANDLVVTSAADGTVRWWAPGGAAVAELPSPIGEIDTVSFSRDGKVVAMATWKGVALWPWREGSATPSACPGAPIPPR